jgi:hypothetical protein
LPLPTLATLRTMERHRVGRRSSQETIITQYIRCKQDDFKKNDGVCELSQSWSEYYGEDIVVFKVKT